MGILSLSHKSKIDLLNLSCQCQYNLEYLLHLIYPLFFLFQTCITKSRERKGLMKSTKDFWSKKQFDNASQYSDHWLISRTHHARGKQALHSGHFCLILSKNYETLLPSKSMKLVSMCFVLQ